MPEHDPLARYGHQPHDPSSLTRKCRLLQSWYRVEVAKQSECGPWRAGTAPVGSSLVAGESSGANFISPAAFAYAKEKVAEKEVNRDLTIDEHRLFNNMLSSQPMCFNLFADLRLGLRAGWPNAGEVVAAMFMESRIAGVESIEVEMIPRPSSEYIDDKTAFDALVLFHGQDGKSGLAAIETKYTDQLGGNVASKQDRKFALAAELNLLTQDGLAWYAERGFDQVARNLLLTFAVARRRNIENAINYVLGPDHDQATPAMIRDLKERLAPEYRDRVVWLSLERVIERGLAAAGGYYADHLLRFRKRYLDFDQIGHLLP